MFVLYFDSKYYHWAPELIKSIRIHEPKEKILVFGTNLEFEQVEYLKSKVEHIELMTMTPPKGEELAWHVIEHKAYYLLRSLLLWPNDSLCVMMDIDMLLLKPLTEVKRVVLKHNFDMACIRANPDKICGGFYVFNTYSIPVRVMLREWNKYLLDGNYFFDKDQASLAQLVGKYEFEHGLNVLSLSRAYLDHKSRPESVIWSAHKSEFGEKHQRFEVYQRVAREMEKKHAKDK